MSLFGVPKPVTVSVDVPRRRHDVYDFLLGAISEEAELEVVEVREDRLITERKISEKGKRVGFGTYELTDLPGKRTCIAFTTTLKQAPAVKRAFGPLVRAAIRHGSQKEIHRLAKQLRAT